MGEITVILLLALIFLGPKKLPDLASGLGRLIRQVRKATADVKSEIALDDTFRKPFEELRDAVTLSGEELKRRDQIKQSIEEARRRAEELEREMAAANPPDEAAPQDAAVVPAPPVEPSVPPPPWAMPAEPAAPPPAPVPTPVARGSSSPLFTMPAGAPTGTVPRREASAPPTRLGSRVTPPVSSLDGDRANSTQVLSEEDLLPPAPPPRPGAHPPPPPPLPGVAKSPPPTPDPKKT